MHPGVRWHQQHRLLLVSVFTDGHNLNRIGLPARRSNVESSGVLGCHDEQVKVRPLRTSQHSFEQNLRPTCASGLRILALKHAVQRTGRVAWRETADSVEPDLATDCPAVTDLAADQDASCVVKSCLSEPLRTGSA